MMSGETMDPTFTERHEEGDFTIEIVVYVANNHVSISFSSPEHEAQFNFDNRLGLHIAEARLHPAFIAEFIENAIGEGEVKYYFERRSDALAKEQNQRSSRGRRGRR